jgi:hypothetical protein
VRRLVPAFLIAFLLFPLAVSAKGGFSPAGGRSSGGFSASRPSAPISRPQSGTFKPLAPPARPDVASQRAGERATHTTVVQRTTVVNSGGGYASNGGSSMSWLLPAFLGYYAGGGCNRRQENNQ